MTDGPSLPDFLPALPGGRFYRLAWVFYLLLALGGVLWVGVREESIPLGLFLNVPTLARDLGLGIGMAAALLGVWWLADRFLPLAKTLEDRLRQAIGPMEPSEAVALALLSGFSEELFFRGAVQGSWGWPVATALFAALHTGGERSMWLWTVFAAVSGAAFGLATMWTGNLLPAMLAHALVNLVNLYRLAARRDEGQGEVG